MIRKIVLSLFLSCFLFAGAIAQELNCTVQVLSPGMQSTNRQVFETLQKEITEFMNNKRWTTDQYLNQERIECSFLINISDRPSTDEFTATIQVQTRRPVFNASYSTSLINFLDENFSFRYIEFEPLDFNDQTFVSTLTSAMAFYAYILIGLDYNTFGKNTGDAYFIKAMNVVTNAQLAKEKGWKAFEGTRNRYWLAENFSNPQLTDMNTVYYNYHRKGLDVMTTNLAEGRTVIMECLQTIKTMNQKRMNSLIMQTFFAAKADELVNIFAEAPVDEKNRAFTILNELDPTNITKYQKILAKK